VYIFWIRGSFQKISVHTYKVCMCMCVCVCLCACVYFLDLGLCSEVLGTYIYSMCVCVHVCVRVWIFWNRGSFHKISECIERVRVHVCVCACVCTFSGSGALLRRSQHICIVCVSVCLSVCLSVCVYFLDLGLCSEDFGTHI